MRHRHGRHLLRRGASARRKIDLDDIAIVSGIGCTGRVAGYVKFDSFHTTHGRAMAFATGLKLGNPRQKVVVFSGDGDLTGIGGNHFIHAARRNMDLVVICINNFNYAMTGGQVAPTSPPGSKMSTAPFGNFEPAFSLPYLAEASGATYVARWTALHIRRVTKSIQEALNHKGFSFIEVITPCPTLYARRNRLGDGLDLMKYYYDSSEIRHGHDTRDTEIDFQGKIICGKFVDKTEADLSRRHELTFHQGPSATSTNLMELTMTDIRFSGFGGQGIIRCALIAGKALNIYGGKFATMTQAIGPEARGGACSSQLVVSDERVLYPYIQQPDILVAMSRRPTTSTTGNSKRAAPSSSTRTWSNRKSSPRG